MHLRPALHCYEQTCCHDVNLGQATFVQRCSYRLCLSLCVEVTPPSPLTTRSLGVVIICTAPFPSRGVWQRGDMIWEKKWEESPVFVFLEFPFMFGTSLVANLAPSLAAGGACTPNHRRRGRQSRQYCDTVTGVLIRKCPKGHHRPTSPNVSLPHSINRHPPVSLRISGLFAGPQPLARSRRSPSASRPRP